MIYVQVYTQNVDHSGTVCFDIMLVTERYEISKICSILLSELCHKNNSKSKKNDLKRSFFLKQF